MQLNLFLWSGKGSRPCMLGAPVAFRVEIMNVQIMLSSLVYPVV